MEIDYIVGSKKEFYEFVNLITHRDKVAILTHIDLDGLASGIFLEKILEAKDIQVDYMNFLNIKKDMLKEENIKLKELGVDKVFICDMGIDSIDPEGFEELRQQADVFLIDHHPLNEGFSDKRNMIKTESQDCAAMICYFLGEGLIDPNEWEWLCCAAIFSDFSCKERKNLEYIQSVYPDVTEENIASSIPGMNGRKINSALIYYEHNKKYVYDLVKERKLDEIKEAHEIIEGEIEEIVGNFTDKAEHYPEKNLHIYCIDSKFNVVSTVCSLVSKMKPEDTFVFYRIKDGLAKFSARNQGGTNNVGMLMKKCTEDLEGASGGGHAPAAAARIRAEDLDEFKKRLLE